MRNSKVIMLKALKEFIKPYKAKSLQLSNMQGVQLLNGMMWNNAGKVSYSSLDFWGKSQSISTCINILTQNFAAIEFTGLPPYPNVYQTWGAFLQQYIYIIKKYGVVYLVRIGESNTDASFVVLAPQQVQDSNVNKTLNYELFNKPLDAEYFANFNLGNVSFKNVKIYEQQLDRVYDLFADPTTGAPRVRTQGLESVIYGEIKLQETYNNVLANTFTVLSPSPSNKEVGIVDAENAAAALVEFAGTGNNEQFLKVVKTPIDLKTVTLDFNNFQKKDTENQIRSIIARAFVIDEILVGGGAGTYENSSQASLNLFLQNLYPEAVKFCQSINSLTDWNVDFVRNYSYATK